MTDKPIAHTAEGRPVYDNTPTVVSVLVTTPENKLIVVRRANDPGYSLLGLPGGYHMRGESWERAGAREVLEETGHAVGPVTPVDHIVTDEYGNNLQIATAQSRGVYSDAKLDGEALEVLEIDSAGVSYDWAFPRHWQAVKEYFERVNVQPVAPARTSTYSHDPMVQLSEQHIRVDNGRLYKLTLTCFACPEQYDVIDDNGKVMGYLRLRGGEFTAHYVLNPAVEFGWEDEPLYTAEPEGDGDFLDEERGQYLTAAVQALHDRHTRP